MRNLYQTRVHMSKINCFIPFQRTDSCSQFLWNKKEICINFCPSDTSKIEMHIQLNMLAAGRVCTALHLVKNLKRRAIDANYYIHSIYSLYFIMFNLAGDVHIYLTQKS